MRSFDSKSLSNDVGDEFEQTIQRINGWMCWHCGKRSKEKRCSSCKRLRNEAELNGIKINR